MKKYIWQGMIAAAILAAAAGAYDTVSSSRTLTGVSDGVCHGETVYLIDNRGENYHLFAADMDGKEKGHIKLPKLSGTWWNAYSSLSVDKDGSVYVYSYGKTMDTNESRSRVFQWDFETETLKQVWELPENKLNRIQVMEGNLYYLNPVGKDQTGLYQREPGKEAHCLLLIEETIDKIKASDYRSDRGLLWADWNGIFYRNETQLLSERKPDYVNISAGETGIVYTDMKKRTMNRINGEGITEALFSTAEASFLGDKVRFLDILPFHFESDGTWSAGVDIQPGRRVLGIFDKNGKQLVQIDRIWKSAGVRGIQALKIVCLGAVVLAVLRLLIAMGLKWTRGTVPIIVQLLVIMIPLIVASAFLLNQKLEDSLRQRILRMEYDLLYLMADEKLKTINPKELINIELDQIPQDRIYRKLFAAKQYTSRSKSLYTAGSSVTEPVIANVYYWMFLLKDGGLRYAEVTGMHYYGGRVAYDRGQQEIDKMNQAMYSRQIVKTEYNDFSGEFIALYVPVTDEDRNVIGILECGLNRRILSYEIEKQMEQIHRMLLVLMGMLILVLTAVLCGRLLPLTKVKAAVEEVSGGGLGRQVTVRGKDEVAKIAEAFNHMSLRLKEQMEFTRACSDGYASFVPEKILEILEREDITRIELGDQREIPAAVLSVGSHQFKRMIKSMTGEALYGMINRMLRMMIPVVAGDSGVIDHMGEDGLTAYYPGRSYEALKSAVSICEKLNRMRQQGEEVPVYRTVVHYGMVRVGIVGQKERMAASTISECIALSRFLQEMGETYGAGILVTQSASDEIPEFKTRFHARMLGYVHILMTDSLEAIYDVYDGDEAEERRLKEETAELFELAVRDYLGGAYYDARLKFAKILRMNPRDLTARAYVYRCDRYYQSDGTEELCIYLEQY